MTNKQILEALSELECVLYYRADGSDSHEGVKPEATEAVHSLIKQALEAWHEATGETL